MRRAFAAVWEDQLKMTDPATLVKLADETALPGEQLVERTDSALVEATVPLLAALSPAEQDRFRELLLKMIVASGASALPADWDRVIREFDGRTIESRKYSEEIAERHHAGNEDDIGNHLKNRQSRERRMAAQVRLVPAVGQKRKVDRKDGVQHHKRRRHQTDCDQDKPPLKSFQIIGCGEERRGLRRM